MSERTPRAERLKDEWTDVIDGWENTAKASLNQAHAVVVLDSSPALAAVVSHWPFIAGEWVPTDGPPTGKKSRALVQQALWANIDWVEIAKKLMPLACMPYCQAVVAVQAARDMSLIYPGGRLSSAAETWMQIEAKFVAMSKGLKERKPPKDAG